MPAKVFDKYFYYAHAVQAPDAEAKFLQKVYTDHYGHPPQTLREDFCGTFRICASWVKQTLGHRAMGVDINPEPLNYGREHTLALLNPEQRGRIQILENNVLDPHLPQAQVICALNFSYFIFKQRAQLKTYFRNAYEGLTQKGVFVLDCFGGALTLSPNEESTELENPDFTYYWDQTQVNPVSHEALFHIHFKLKGQRKRKKVFTYDWRMWSLAELKDLLVEVGFQEVVVYWEGTTRQGEGNGVFRPTTKGDACEAWVAYIVGMK